MSGGASSERKIQPEAYAVARGRWMVVAAVVADHEGVRLTAVQYAGGGETRAGLELIRARRLSCYLAQVAAEISQHALANVSRLTRKTIREHVRWVEDARGDGDGPLSIELDALTAEIQLRLASRAYAAARRELEGARRLAAQAGAAPPPLLSALDPELDAMLSAIARKEDAQAAWRRLCDQTEAQLAAVEAGQGAALLGRAASEGPPDADPS
ncbi:hypothetical protein [Caulobacter sp. BK020]|uniref:hypothetical protein n=1 Tax=Caulobacter sp. BK020 TaxID=2512117 RepID=UPI00104CB777|nr:hypothetical protein [Caulobacter sp. BK020]TCS14562.1 hypothetical protein EV278_107211 [Caulobacter sp. BK020]